MMPGIGPADARYLIVGDFPSEHDMIRAEPFSGPAGEELNRMLHEAGILRSECFLTNICRQRPPGKGDLEEWFVRKKKSPGEAWQASLGGWAQAPILDGLTLFRREIDLVKPKVIIPTGNLALLATAGEWGISNWRGSELEGIGGSAVIPTLPPSSILKQWSNRSYVVCDLRRAKRQLGLPGVVRPQLRIIVRPHYAQALSCLQSLLGMLAKGPMLLSCDIETRAGHIACLGIGWSKHDAICIPLMCSERTEGYWTQDEEASLMRQVQLILEHPNARVTGQNFIYDTQYTWRHYRIRARLAIDTMLTHHVCFPGSDKDLATLSSLYCEHHRYWKDDGKEWEGDKDEDRYWRYNGEDCCRTYEIAEQLIDVVRQLGLEEQCYFQHKMWWRALDVMIRGVALDLAEKKKLSHTLMQEVTAREAWFTEVLGHTLNVKSPQQMKALFYEDLRLPVQRNRASRAPSCDDEALTKLAEKEPLVRPIIRKIREVRSLGVFRSTFVEARPDKDQRMRCSYNVAGTATFRFSSAQDAFGSGLNLQNIPKGGDADDEVDSLELPNVRVLFKPDPGYEIFDMDLDSADLRIVTFESDCREMKAMFAEKKKPYIEIAKEYYRDPTISKAHPKYGTFKSLCHGTNYLGTSRGIAPRVGLITHEVERIQKWYFGRFPEIKNWQEALKEQMRRTRTVRNAFGYRRIFFDRVDDSMFREGVAWIPQSTVGLLINKIWDNIVEAEPEVLALMQVHDSLVGQYPISKAEYYRTRLQELSLVAVPYADPLIIPTGFKYSQRSWGDCG